MKDLNKEKICIIKKNKVECKDILDDNQLSSKTFSFSNEEFKKEKKKSIIILDSFHNWNVFKNENLNQIKKYLFIGFISFTLFILLYSIESIRIIHNNVLIVILLFTTIFSLYIIGFIDITSYIRKTVHHHKVPIYFKVIIMISIILTSSIFSLLLICPLIRVDNKPPQLLISESSGIYGIPNMAVSFYTLEPSLNLLEWGNSTNTFSYAENIISKQHGIMLRDLYPNTDYWYSINNGIKYNFTTSNIDTFSFAVSSDSHFGRIGMDNNDTINMIKSIKNNKYNYFLQLGDIVDLGFIDSHWQNMIESMSPYTSQLPIRPLIGNHDALLGGRKLFGDYLYPDTMDIENGTKFYFKFDIGNVHFICLDLQWSTESFSKQQENWLINELKYIPDEDWIIIFSHGFYYASGKYDIFGMKWFDNEKNINKLVPIFEQYNVDLVFSGHTHTMEVLEKEGIFYNIIGGFGANNYDKDINNPSLYSNWRLDETHGYIGVNVSNTQLLLNYYDVNNVLLYNYSIQK